MLRQRTNITKSETTSDSADRPQIKKSKLKKRSGKRFFAFVIASILIVLYVIVPLIFYLSPSVRRHAVFLHYVSFSRNKNLSHPVDLGLNCTRHFFIPSEDSIQLGTWHIPPAHRCDQGVLSPDEEFEDNAPVFLYLHGNAGTRGGSHRVQLYKVLSEKVNSHIVAFDYRGYGDSSNVPPTDAGIVSDTLRAYDWLSQKVDYKRIIIWGHSLGTGVATATLEVLSSNGKTPLGVILEAPFTKLIDVVKHHPLSFLHRHMPFFDFFFSYPIGNETGAFDSISRIGAIKAPVLILHAEDDGFVPFYQGKELYEKAIVERSSDLYPTQFIAFEKKLDYGHKNIYKDPSLPTIVKTFIDNHSNNLIKT